MARATTSSSSREFTIESSRARGIAGIVLLAVGLFSAAALVSLQLGSGTLMGPFGHLVARGLYALAGVGAHLIAIAMVLAPLRLLSGRKVVRGTFEAIGFGCGLVSLVVLLHLVGRGYRVDGVGAGGVLGEYLAEVLRAVVSTAGTILVASMGLLVALAVTTRFRMSTLVNWMGRGAHAVARGVRFVVVEAARFVADVVRAILPERDEPEADSQSEAEREPAFAAEDSAPIETMGDDTIRVGPPDGMDPVIIVPRGRKKKLRVAPPLLDDPMANESTPRADGTPPPPPRAALARPTPAIAPSSSASKGEATIETPPSPEALDSSDVVAEAIVAKPVAVPTPAPVAGVPAAVARLTASAARAMNSPTIVEPEFHKPAVTEMKKLEKQAAENRPDYVPLGDGIYRLPPVSMLSYDDAGIKIDRDAMLEVSAKLVKALSDFGVRGEVQAIRPGPVVTMYEFVPVAGTRVNKITNLSDDLAMRLEAMKVRIVAPIPGKNAVGIEVPNKIRETVYLKEIIADDVFQKARSKLTIALGKDIEGRPVAVDLAKMPHLLVAGTTGAGKSVSVNAMIMSLLFNATPEEVRLIMVDPKMLELSIYEGIPHLLLPVVTDPKKANLALRWAVEEMERRYEMLAEAGVRDLISYNKKAEAAIATAAATPPAEGEGDGSEPIPTKPTMRKLPFIVVIIDEFADLMMTAAKEVEMSVARIAQKARAAGIHLLLATQRPSVDVITGLIKANFPSRVAFQVASKIDSRTILDQQGAEALLGQGDMLFTDRGSSLRRVHGCLVQDAEIMEVVAMLKKQGKPVYDMDILKPRVDDEGEGGSNPDDEEDSEWAEQYDRAVALVAETRQASISMIQRRLRIGYNRAARMVEKMEREGIVGPADGPNRRQVLIQASV